MLYRETYGKRLGPLGKKFWILRKKVKFWLFSQKKTKLKLSPVCLFLPVALIFFQRKILRCLCFQKVWNLLLDWSLSSYQWWAPDWWCYWLVWCLFSGTNCLHDLKASTSASAFYNISQCYRYLLCVHAWACRQYTVFACVCVEGGFMLGLDVVSG